MASRRYSPAASVLLLAAAAAGAAWLYLPGLLRGLGGLLGGIPGEIRGAVAGAVDAVMKAAGLDAETRRKWAGPVGDGLLALSLAGLATAGARAAAVRWAPKLAAKVGGLAYARFIAPVLALAAAGYVVAYGWPGGAPGGILGGQGATPDAPGPARGVARPQDVMEPSEICARRGGVRTIYLAKGDPRTARYLGCQCKDGYTTQRGRFQNRNAAGGWSVQQRNPDGSIAR